MSAIHDSSSEAVFGKDLVEKTAIELARRLRANSIEQPELCSLMLLNHYTIEIAMQHLGHEGVTFMLQAAEMFAIQAVTGEVAE